MINILNKKNLPTECSLDFCFFLRCLFLASNHIGEKVRSTYYASWGGIPWALGGDHTATVHTDMHSEWIRLYPLFRVWEWVSWTLVQVRVHIPLQGAWSGDAREWIHGHPRVLTFLFLSSMRYGLKTFQQEESEQIESLSAAHRPDVESDFGSQPILNQDREAEGWSWLIAEKEHVREWPNR